MIWLTCSERARITHYYLAHSVEMSDIHECHSHYLMEAVLASRKSLLWNIKGRADGNRAFAIDHRVTLEDAITETN